MGEGEGRRTRADARRNRERILQAAVGALADDQDVPLNAVARRAGVGQGTLYRHFADREALLWAVHEREAERLARRADELLAAVEPGDALRSWLDALADFALTKANLAAALRTTAIETEEPARKGFQAVHDAIGRLIEANKAAGTVGRDISIDDLVVAVAGIWQIPEGPSRDRRVKRLLDLVVAGLRHL